MRHRSVSTTALAAVLALAGVGCEPVPLDPAAPVAPVTVSMARGHADLPAARTVDPGSVGSGVEYEVFIPSADQTGIKTDQGFTVPEGGGDVVLLFDEDATWANLDVTGNGRVILAPVIHVVDEPAE